MSFATGLENCLAEPPAVLVGRRFGLFHFQNRSTVRVRKVVMTGNWPEKLPADLLDNLTATTTPNVDQTIMNAVFGEDDLAKNVFAVLRHTASMSDEERFRYLSKWVLPSRGRRSFRLTGAFTTTNPAPNDAAARTDDVGGQLVSAAYDLIDVAVRTTCPGWRFTAMHIT